MPLVEQALCTVCIPAFNQAEHLRAAIESVAAQTVPVQLLVADDASPDNTEDVLRALQETLPFRAHCHRKNLGISANLNWLLRNAQTRFVVRLDSDDLLHPRFVEVLQDLLERMPNAGCAHAAVQEIGPQGELLGERRLARSSLWQDAETALRRSVKGYQVTANILMFRRDALASVDFGTVSPALNFVEDHDLSIRLADAGWGNIYSPEVLASYRMWTAPSRPIVGRKLREVQGIMNVFEGSLQSAFQRRHWSLRPLRRRRWQLALANAEILDRGNFQAGEREIMVQALLGLGGSPALRWFLGTGWLASMVRRSLHQRVLLWQATKRHLKVLLFRYRVSPAAA